MFADDFDGRGPAVAPPTGTIRGMQVLVPVGTVPVPIVLFDLADAVPVPNTARRHESKMAFLCISSKDAIERGEMCSCITGVKDTCTLCVNLTVGSYL